MQLDHIAVSASTLIEAVDAVETALGVALQPGGRHDVFGTHNRLLGLADGLYLEAIAIDPGAPKPDRPRWFDLDRFSGPPRLTNWICRTDDLDATLAALAPQVGAPVALKRETLAWTMAVPADGVLPFDNLHPAVIAWASPVHPSALLTRSGCALRRLIVRHPEARALQSALSGQFRDDRVVFDPGVAGLEAEIDTPHGMRRLA